MTMCYYMFASCFMCCHSNYATFSIEMDVNYIRFQFPTNLFEMLNIFTGAYTQLCTYITLFTSI